MMGLRWFLKWSPPDAAYCKADWRLLLGADYGRVEPFLEIVRGCVTGSYPDEKGGPRYEVRLHEDCWLGVPTDGGEESAESEWPRLTVADVQLWRVNEKERSALVRECESASIGDGILKTENRRQPGDVRVSPDYKVIRIGMREVDLSRKPKARAFLRFVRERSGKSEFHVEEMREAFNVQFGDEREGKGWNSDRLREDLFRGLGKEDFDLMFDTVNLGAGIYRLKI